MNLEEQIRSCKKEMLVTPEEKHIQETIKKSIDTFMDLYKTPFKTDLIINISYRCCCIIIG